MTEPPRHHSVILAIGHDQLGPVTAKRLADRAERTIVVITREGDAGYLPRALDGVALTARADADLDDVVSMVAEQHGEPTVLVTFPAEQQPSPLLDAAHAAIASADLEATLALQAAVGRRMLAGGGGAIVHVVSGAGFVARAHHGAETASAGALVSLTRTAALEFAPLVRVNAVATSPDPAVRPADEDVAEVIAFLASNAARGMTGAIVHANGGSYMPH